MKNLTIKTLLILNLIFFNFIITYSQLGVTCQNNLIGCDDGNPSEININDIPVLNCDCDGLQVLLPPIFNETIYEGTPIELSNYFTEVDDLFGPCYTFRLAASLVYDNRTVQLTEQIQDFYLTELPITNIVIDPDILFVDVNGEISNAGELIDPVNPLTGDPWDISVEIIITCPETSLSSIFIIDVQYLPAEDSPCLTFDYVNPDQSGSVSGYNWSMNYETSENDGMVLTDIRLGSRKMVERLSIPYIRFSTALNGEEILRLELKDSCATEPYSSRLIDFDVMNSGGKLSLISVYEIKNIKNNPYGVLKVTQRYEFQKVADNTCEPQDLKFGLAEFAIDKLSPLKTPCNYFRFTVEYDFLGDTGGDIFVDIPQRIHTKVDDVEENRVRFFRDVDLDKFNLPECPGGLLAAIVLPGVCGPSVINNLIPNSLSEGFSPIDNSFYVDEEKVINAISGGKKAEMDNFHLSSARTITGPTLINPGCPECMHVHWRWSNAIEDEGFGDGNPIIPEGSNQDLDIGIVNYNEDEIDPMQKWEDLVNGGSLGQGLVMWYGSKGYQKSDQFFSHDGFFLTEFIDISVEIKLDEEEDAIPLGQEFTFEVEITNNGFASVQEVNLELKLFPVFALEVINVGDCVFDGNTTIKCLNTDLDAGEKATFPITIKIIDNILEQELQNITASISYNSTLFDSNEDNNNDNVEIRILNPIDLNIECLVQNNNNELEINEEGQIEFILSNNSNYSDFIDILSPFFEVCLPDEIRPTEVSSENGICIIDFANDDGSKIICSYPDNPGKRAKSNRNYNNLMEFDTVTLTVEGVYPGEAEVIATLKSLSPEAFSANNSDTLIINVLPSDSLLTWYQDLDKDNLGNPLVDSVSTTSPIGYVFNNNDTDDNCNGIHDECGICNGNGQGIWFRDSDGDGLGNLEIAIKACTKPSGFVNNHNDDNDDEECKGELDECNVCNGRGKISWYQDLDGDGLGNINVAVSACRQPNGYVANTNDDNDNEECKGEIDECGICNGNGILLWFQDLDGDGLGSNLAVLNCKQPDGFVYNNFDDEDICPGNYDECGVCNGTGPITWYQDLDGDGEGNPSTNIISCLPPNGFVSNDTDENDNEPCNGEVDACGICNGYDGDLYFEDADGDGLGNRTSWLLTCEKPKGHVTNYDDTDDTAVYVGVNQIQAVKDFSIEAIVPMPVHQYFDLLIKSKKAKVVSVEIYNSVGQILYQQNNQLRPQLNELRIDVSDLPDGIHLLSVKSSKSIITDKIIKY